MAYQEELGGEEKIKLNKKTTKRANRTTGEDGKRRNNQGTYNYKREKKRDPINTKE
jgi:hypothetical protein